MLTAYSQGVGLPLWWTLLDNHSGNSNTLDRIASVCADREFIGKAWYKWLLENKIRFYLRLPKSHLIQVGRHRLKPESLLGERQKALLDNIEVAEFRLSVALERVVKVKRVFNEVWHG